MLLHEGAGFHALACSCVSVQPLSPVNSSIATAWTFTLKIHSWGTLATYLYKLCLATACRGSESQSVYRPAATPGQLQIRPGPHSDQFSLDSLRSLGMLTCFTP